MSKIFEKNWKPTGATIYWKRFAELVTGLRDKYRADLFFRTQCNVIALQTLFIIGVIVFLWIALLYIQQDIRQNMVSGILGIIESDGAITGDLVRETVKDVRVRNFTGVALIILGVTALFGYIVARITLAPARSALESQKRFINDIAHELRTPLATIKTNTEVILLTEDRDSTRMTLTSNLEELDRVTHIIDNLLSFDSFFRTPRVSFSDVDLGMVVDTAAKGLGRLLRSKKHELIIRRSEYRLVRGNATALEQVVINLLRNAIDHTPENGQIVIAMEPDYHGALKLSIRDTGTGIAREDLFHIFEPFYRAERSRTRRGSGSGMGLAIVNEIVKMHHGRIAIKSAPGRGTVVSVVLPCGTGEHVHTQHVDVGGEVAIDFSELPRDAQ